MTGGASADIFVVARGDGRDWVENFQNGTDRLRLEGMLALCRCGRLRQIAADCGGLRRT